MNGITDLAVFTSLGQPTVQIDIDRARAARYGLTPGDINATIRVAIGGDSAGDLYEPGSDRHFPIVVRLAPQFRQSADAIQNLRIGAQGPNGITQIPLSEVATVRLVSGASYIYRERQERYLPIKFSVRDRDLGSAIQEAQAKIAAHVPLPVGSRLEWVGEFGNLQDAIARLTIVVPVSLRADCAAALINFGSVPDTLLAMSVIPWRWSAGFSRCWSLSTVQRLGRDRVYCIVRHLGYGWDYYFIAIQSAYRRGLDRAACRAAHG